MARNSLFRVCDSIVRNGVGRRLRVSPSSSSSSSSSIRNSFVNTASLSSVVSAPSTNHSLLSFHNTLNKSYCSASVFLLPLNFRAFSSAAAEAPSNIVLIKTEDELNNAYSKVKDDSLPAIFYFTAAWCGPCRMIVPVIKNWSEEFPHVTTYKIDIDEAGLQGALGKLGITAVPTLHFFHKGKKESEVVGADIVSMNATVQRLFK